MENKYYGEVIKITEGIECLNEILEGLSQTLPFDSITEVPQLTENDKVKWVFFANFDRSEVRITASTTYDDKRLYSFFLEDCYGSTPKNPIYRLYVKAELERVKSGFFEGYIEGIRAVEVIVDFTYPGGLYPMCKPFEGLKTVEEYVRETVEKALSFAKSEGKRCGSLLL